MKAKVLSNYMKDCRWYGWTPTFAGLKAYASNEYWGKRLRWLDSAPVCLAGVGKR